jgi:hypothetical protein
MNDFQTLLQKAKQNVQKRPENKTNGQKPKPDDFQKTALALPSEIIISKPKPVEKRNPKPEKQDKPDKPSKITSFKKLMQLAKAVKPEGLIRDGSTVEAPRASKKAHATFQSSKKADVIGKHRENLSLAKSLPKHSNTKQNSSFRAPSAVSTKQKVVIDGKGRINSKTGVSTELIKLNIVKRDLATIEEIEEERRLKKLKSSAKDVHPLRGNRNPKTPGLTHKLPVHASISRATPPNHTTSKHKLPIPNVRPQTQESNNYSSIISKMFGYDRSRYRDESSDDDMEVNFRDLEREERRRYTILIQYKNR